ncbi:MAG: LysR family transcriptional regulator [Clostridiales Family XIII bacterium]|nr:LysR family transcriptional regulator [Clostridiales Family XIII bacterium]
MELRQLRYFVTIAEHLSFTKAAKYLYVAQPALSHSVANLELEMNVKLFERNQHNVCLTKPGIYFLEDAKRIIALSEEAIQKARQVEFGYKWDLNIGFLPVPFYKHFLPKRIAEFSAAHKDTRLNITQYNSGVLYEALKHKDLDIGFTISCDAIDSAEFETYTFMKDRIFLIVRVDHPLAARESLSFQEITDEPFVMLSERESTGYFNMVIKICRSRGFKPNIVCMPTSLETVLMLTEAGTGMTILPSTSRIEHYASLKAIELEGADTEIDMVIAWRKPNRNPILPDFIEYLKSTMCEYTDGIIQKS